MNISKQVQLGNYIRFIGYLDNIENGVLVSFAATRPGEGWQAGYVEPYGFRCNEQDKVMEALGFTSTRHQDIPGHMWNEYREHLLTVFPDLSL